MAFTHQHASSQSVCLPSIREMFPEYVAETSPPKATNSDTPYRSHVSRRHSARIDSNHRTPAALQTSFHHHQHSTNHPTSHHISTPDTHRPNSYTTPTPKFINHSPSSPQHVSPSASTFRPYKYVAADTSPLPPSSPTDHQGHIVTQTHGQAYFFDVLRSDPLTSSLEHIASSTSIRNRGSMGQQDLSAGIANGSAPAFRVSIPHNPDSSSSSPAASSSPTTINGRKRSTSHHHGDEGTTTTNINTSTAFPFTRARNTSSPPSPPASAPAIISFPLSGSAASISNAGLPGVRRTVVTAGGGGGGRLGGDDQHLGDPSYCSSEGGKRHECPHCNKRFNRPSSLRIHVNTHTGAKPFQCPFPNCGRQFNVNSNMRRHYRNHVRSGMFPQPTSATDNTGQPHSHRVHSTTPTRGFVGSASPPGPPPPRSSWRVDEEIYDMEESFDDDDESDAEEDELCEFDDDDADADELAALSEDEEAEESATCSSISSPSSLPPTPTHFYQPVHSHSHSHVRTRPDQPTSSPSISPSTSVSPTSPFDCRFTNTRADMHAWSHPMQPRPAFSSRAVLTSKSKVKPEA